MSEHAVVIAGGGPTGLMLAGELALAGVDVVIVERRVSQDLDGSRSGGLHSRTIEVLDQRGIAERFLAEGQVMQVQGFALIPLDISDFPTRHNYGLALWQSHCERILAGWVGELGVPILRGCEVVGFAQDGTGVDVELAGYSSLRAEYLAGCDGGRSLVRKAAGIDFPGSDPSTSWMIAEVEMDEEPQLGIRRDGAGTHAIGRREAGEPIRVVLTERHVEHTGDPSMDELRQALVAVYGTDTYHAERHPVGARVLHNAMAQVALSGSDDRHQALRDTMTELLSMDEPRRHIAAMLSGLDVHYELGDGHPLLGRRMPDLDLHTADGPTRVFALLHDARPVLLDLGEPVGFDISPWADRVRLVDARHDGGWELPVLGEIAAPSAVLIRPDGHVAWAGDLTDPELPRALATWFGAGHSTPSPIRGVTGMASENGELVMRRAETR